MLNISRRGRAFALSVGLSGLSLVIPSVAFAWQPIVNESLLWLRWRSPIISVRLATPWPEAFPVETLEGVVTRSLQAWDEPDCGQPTFRFDGAGESPALDEEDGVTTIVPITDKEAWNQRFGVTELARTLIISRTRTGTIIDADIVLNINGFPFLAAIECDPEFYDLQATITHELGHVLGLDHSDVEGATMSRKSEEGNCPIRTLAPDDIEGVCGVYPEPMVVEPGPEPMPEPVVEDALTAEPDRARRPGLACASGTASGDWLFLVPFIWLALRRARGPEASG